MVDPKHVTWEEMLLAEVESRQRLLAALLRQPELCKLWDQWVQAQSALVEASGGSIRTLLDHHDGFLKSGDRDVAALYVEQIRVDLGRLESAALAIKS